MKKTYSVTGSVVRWRVHLQILAFSLVLSVVVGCGLPGTLSAVAQRHQTTVSMLTVSDDAPLQADAQPSVVEDPCAWDYTLWTGVENHPFGC